MSSRPLPAMTSQITKTRAYSFDSKCKDLAEHFLPTGASEKLVNDLAQAIQDAVEDHFELELMKHAAP